MQRLYSMFPLNGPGVGLIFLRGALVLSLAYTRASMEQDPGIFLLVCLVAVVCSLTLGFLTPLMAWLVVVSGVIGLFQYGGLRQAFAGTSVTIAFALFFLGPGAYSLDALIYGRRIVEVAPHHDE